MSSKSNYALLGREDKERAYWVNAEGELDSLIRMATVWYDDIKKKYPEIGIGDTATDRAIVDRLYRAIHFAETPN